MPIFEYSCGNCGCIFSLLILGKEDTPVCTSCGSADARKILSSFSCSSSAGSSAGSHFPAGGG